MTATLTPFLSAPEQHVHLDPMREWIAEVEKQPLCRKWWLESANRSVSEELRFIKDEAAHFRDHMRKCPGNAQVFFCLSQLLKSINVPGMGEKVAKILVEEVEAMMPDPVPGKNTMRDFCTAMFELATSEVGEEKRRVEEVMHIASIKSGTSDEKGEHQWDSAFETALPSMMAEIRARINALKPTYTKFFILKWFLQVILAKPEEFLRRSALWTRSIQQTEAKFACFWTTCGDVANTFIAQGRTLETWWAVGFSHTELHEFLDVLTSRVMPRFVFSLDRLQHVYAKHADETASLKNKAVAGLAAAFLGLFEVLGKSQQEKIIAFVHRNATEHASFG